MSNPAKRRQKKASCYPQKPKKPWKYGPTAKKLRRCRVCREILGLSEPFICLECYLQLMNGDLEEIDP